MDLNPQNKLPAGVDPYAHFWTNLLFFVILPIAVILASIYVLPLMENIANFFLG